jgi:hypothetical protein
MEQDQNTRETTMEHGDPATISDGGPKEVQGVVALRRAETSRDEPAIAIPIDGVVSLERTNVTHPSGYLPRPEPRRFGLLRVLLKLRP